MAHEVSSYFLRAILEAGELFGVERAELLTLLPDPQVAGRRWGSVGWVDFLSVFRAAVAPAGRGEMLIAAGRRYMRERHGTRTAHLYGEFLSWDKVLWVAKNFMAPRLLKGYRIEYEKLGTDHFRVSMSIPETLEGDRDFFFYLTGLWTGSSRTANLRHELLSLAVTPHSGVAEIKLGKRSSASRWLYNPLVSAMATRAELRRTLADLREQRRELRRVEADLRKVLDATADLVWMESDGGVLWANGNALRLQERSLPSTPTLAEWAERAAAGSVARILDRGGRVLRLRDVTPLPEEGGRLITVADETARREAEQRVGKAPETARQEAAGLLAKRLDGRLKALDAKLQEAESAEERGSPSERKIGEMRHFVERCRDWGAVLVAGDESLIGSAADFHDNLARLAQGFASLFRFEVVVEGRKLPVQEEPESLREFFLICQEAVRNAWRHSGGRRVVVRLYPSGADILDDGNGLSETSTSESGIGLASIRRRAESLGLSARLARPPQNGWIFSQAEEEDLL